jgi:hypothetical protein
VEVRAYVVTERHEFGVEDHGTPWKLRHGLSNCEEAVGQALPGREKRRTVEPSLWAW